MSTEESIVTADDGLIAPVVGDWSEKKYSLIGYYAKLFATGMKKKWDCRVYIDLFAGSGRAKIEGIDKFIETSSIIAINTGNKFDKYIFCDLNNDKINALESRFRKISPEMDADFLNIDSNKSCHEILKCIPGHHYGFKVLAFCVIDPYKLGNLHFQTIETLSEKFMDFLVLIPSYMDANRNLMNYIKVENKTVDNFLGYSGWRSEWREEERKYPNFGEFITSKFCNKMKGLDFLSEIEDSELVKSSSKNLPLYRLVFFSKSMTGIDFWRKSKYGSNPQQNLFS